MRAMKPRDPDAVFATRDRLLQRLQEVQGQMDHARQVIQQARHLLAEGHRHRAHRPRPQPSPNE